MKTLILLLVLFCSVTTYASEYEEGSIIKNDDTIVTGLIKYEADNYLKFKINSEEKAIKYTSHELIGFTVGTKEYTILENVEYNGVWLGKAKKIEYLYKY